MKDRRRSLTAIHDLEIPQAFDPLLAVSRRYQFDFRRCGGETVVVGEKPVRFLQQCLPNPFVDRASSLKKRPYVAFQEPCTEATINVSQEVAGNEGQVGLVIGSSRASH